MSSEEYSNRVLKQSNWNEVADIIYDDWQNLEENTKQKRSKFHSNEFIIYSTIYLYHSLHKTKYHNLHSIYGFTHSVTLFLPVATTYKYFSCQGSFPSLRK